METKQGRVILHVDMNAFFSSVEQAANPALRNKPIVVGGGIKKGSVVAAASYEAKAYGVKNGMSTREAQKICPGLVVVIGDMTKYIYTSKVIMEMLRTYTDLVEIFSIDEAFMDVTLTKDRFGGEAALAKEIKQRIKKKLGLTCSIGISFNKLMAKLAGELQKPDGLVVLKQRDIPAKIENLPVKELCGIGRKSEQYLAEMGIRTFGQLNRYSREKLVKRFGSVYGEQFWQMGQGRGLDIVQPYYAQTDAKSMGHSYTLPNFTKNMDEVLAYLLRLAEQVGRRLRRDNYKGNVIRVSLGFGDYKFWSKQKKVEEYVDDGYLIFQVTERLIKLTPRIWQEGRGVRFVGVSVSSLIHNLDQLSIFEATEKQKQMLNAVDAINNRFGEFTLERATVMHTMLQGKTGMIAPNLYRA